MRFGKIRKKAIDALAQPFKELLFVNDASTVHAARSPRKTLVAQERGKGIREVQLNIRRQLAEAQATHIIESADEIDRTKQ